MPERILVTGGAGFVGSNLAIRIKTESPDREVIALDNLSRAGSELGVLRLRDSGVTFLHGDVRSIDDIEKVGAVDWLIECSAEPSVHAGYGSSPRYLIHTNLVGAINCLEHLRISGGRMIFMSSSRVYPMAALRSLPMSRDGERLTIESGRSGVGWSKYGISEAFPLDGFRSMYGATKLAAELLIKEYAAMYGVRTVTNRCGVLAGPWQFGKVDQGFLALWVARHVFGGELRYMGYGGEGLQVRDVLHVDDLFELLQSQMRRFDEVSGETFNVGGGQKVSVSLRELTSICQNVTGNEINILGEEVTRDADIPYFISDSRQISKSLDWQPQKDVRTLVSDIHDWLRNHEDVLRPLFQ